MIHASYLTFFSPIFLAGKSVKTLDEKGEKQFSQLGNKTSAVKKTFVPSSV